MWEQSADWRIAAQKYTIDAFQKQHPNVTIRIESFPFVEYQTKINNSLPAGTAADIITTVGQWADPWINAGWIAPIPSDVVTPEGMLNDFSAWGCEQAIVMARFICSRTRPRWVWGINL